MKKRMAGMLALLSAVAITVTGCSVGNTPDYSKEAINVAGVSVPLKEVNFLLRYQQTQMQSFYGNQENFGIPFFVLYLKY